MAKIEKKSGKKAPKVHPELEGFELTIDHFGQIVSTLDRDKINQFLDKHLPEDKKLKNRSDEN